MEMNYASRGVGNAALATGIIGTAGAALNLLNTHNGCGLLGMGACTSDVGTMGAAVANAAAEKMLGVGTCEGDRPVTRYELGLVRELDAERQKNAILTSEQNTENKMTEVYRQAHNEVVALRDREDLRHDAQEAWNAQQMVNNAQIASAVAANANSIAAIGGKLDGVTRTVIPNGAICPGWGAVKTQPECCANGCPNGGGTTIS